MIRNLAALALVAGAVSCAAQQIALPDAPAPRQLAAVSEDAQVQQDQSSTSQIQQHNPRGKYKTPTSPANSNAVPRVDQQPTRILGLMPNYRAVSAGALPPPPTPKEAFMVATDNCFDYSAFVFVGLTSLIAEGGGSHPQLGKGLPGFWRYYWRGFVDKTDGDYLVDFVLPTFMHEDERYYAKGDGGGSIWNRTVYSATRVIITPDYHGKNTFNAAEILGRGIAQAVSLTYYPTATQSPGAFADKYAWAVGRDAATNVFREFWPDINARVIHRRHHAALAE